MKTFRIICLLACLVILGYHVYDLDYHDFGVATFEWTKKIRPFALTLQNGKKEKDLQFRIQA